MKAIIMAGGKGTRLLPISEFAPKPMTKLLGTPLLEHLIFLLKNNGFTELCMTLGHQSDCIKNHFGNGSRFGVNISYRLEDEPLGTAGGVRACEDFYGNDDFLVISGDAACDFDLKTLFQSHLDGKNSLTMALFPHLEPLRYGTVLTDRSGKIVSFIEKPTWNRVVTDLVNTGIYVVSPKTMALVPKNEVFDFARDLFPLLLEREEALIGHSVEGYWCDIGDSASYLRCSMDALDSNLKITTAPEDFLFSGTETLAMKNDICIGAPSVICGGAQIGAGTVIEHSVLHPNSMVGENCHIKNAVIDGIVGDNCIVSDTVVCRGAGVYPQTVTASGSVISRPNAKLAPALRPLETERPREKGLCREISCTARAGLMRQMSAVLWETGADFSDGIILKDGNCKVRIYPLSDRSAIAVEAAGGRESDRLSACKKYGSLAEGFDRRLNIDKNE